jgi:hypothetical protein
MKTQPNQWHHRPSFERLTITQRLQPFARFDHPPDPAQLRSFILVRGQRRQVHEGEGAKEQQRCDWNNMPSISRHRFVITIRK